LKKDRFGLAVSSIRYENAEVKSVALAAREGGQYFQVTKENLISREYPLTRITYAFVNQAPGQPIEPKVKEFLGYIFSREGQADVERDRGYLRLNQESLIEQLKKLN